MVGEYFDPKIDAQTHGYNLGLTEGEHHGYKRGRADGYNEGHNHGYRAGWDEAVAQANQRLLLQMEFTRQHVADKAAQATQLGKQQELIDQLDAYRKTLEKDVDVLKKWGKQALEHMTALEAQKAQLSEEVSQLRRSAPALPADHVWTYNQLMLCADAMRYTIAEVLEAGNDANGQIRKSFERTYRDMANAALSKGTIRIAPEGDVAFAKTFPKTQRFLLDMLTTHGKQPQRP